MTIIEAIILGAVQGLTEFLPVSSSGHLVLVQKIFGISESALLFDTMVHAGTLLAVFVVLRKDIGDILRRIVQPLSGFLIIATIPAVVAALLFKSAIEEAFSSASFLGFAFLLTAFILVSAEWLSSRAGRLRSGREMFWKDALVIGCMQAIAVIPGVSRSGSTLSGALVRKLDRDFAARFSFLLSIPAILGALVLQLKDLASGAAVGESGIGALPIIVGTVTAAIVGFFSIKLMLKVVKEQSLFGFAIYVAVLGVLVLIDTRLSHFFFS